MSEHWKSTPKYWCKYCSIFVRDTKLERQNHEATGKHQGALKRFLRDLHRGHEREEKDKERARREVERLNGVVGSTSGSSSAGPSGSRPGQDTSGKATASQLAKQREQLAALGVAMPSEFRPEMAMAGEWTVTARRVVDDTEEKKDPGRIEAKASGIRKREATEEEKEEAAALQGLFKKQKRWGGTRTMPEEDTELDALLSGDLLQAPRPKKEEAEEDEKSPRLGFKKEDGEDSTQGQTTATPVKSEPVDDEGGLDANEKTAAPSIPDAAVKNEDETPGDVPAPVMFKKRKPKNIRQK